MDPGLPPPRPPSPSTPVWFHEPSWWQRFAGCLVDALVYGGFAVAGLVLFWLAIDVPSGWATTVALGVLRCAYVVWCTATTGQTLGKLALGTKVVDAADGQVIDARRAVLRWFVLDGLPVMAVLALGTPAASADSGPSSSSSRSCRGRCTGGSTTGPPGPSSPPSDRARRGR